MRIVFDPDPLKDKPPARERPKAAVETSNTQKKGRGKAKNEKGHERYTSFGSGEVTVRFAPPWSQRADLVNRVVSAEES